MPLEKNRNQNVLQKILERLERLMSGKNHDQNVLQKIFEELNSQSKPIKQSEIPRRIELCQQALETEMKPDLRAMLQNDLACSLLESPIGPKAENIEQAIHHFNQALKVRTFEKYPKEWAMTVNNMATAYRDRIGGKRADDIEQAIHYYELALTVRTREIDPVNWAMTQHNLAGAYYKRICEDRAENLEQAIRYANQALEVYTREAYSHEWAKTQNTLGEIYRIRIRESRKENIEQAICTFNQALEVHTREAFLEDWARLQQNLGAAYIVRLDGLRAENTERAIYHCQQALEVYTREAFPHDWASIQYNLGNAYGNRIRGDRGENIEQSIWHFQQALEVSTHHAFPEDWARIQNNLGNSYLARSRSERKQNIEKAISHYQHALEVYTSQSFPEDWARTCNNLGNAYLALVPDEQTKTAEQMKNIEQAIFNYNLALKVRTHQAFPEDWTETQSNLTGAERIRASAEDLEHAIQHLLPVLNVYTRKIYPQYWARTHNNLAIIYTNRKQGEPAKNIKKAVWHYQQALEVYTLQNFPNNCLKTARGLGMLAFDEQRWELARDAYDTVSMAQDALMHDSFSPASEKAGLAEVQNLPPRAAYAHVKSGELERAVEVMEKGRAQLLRESFEFQHQKLKQLPVLGFENLYNDYIQARDEYQALQNMKALKDESPADWKQALEKVQAAAAAIREVAGRHHLQYRHFLKTLSFSEIQEQALEHPIVYLCATSAGGVALVVSKQGVQAIEISELKQEALQKRWRPSNEQIDQINAHLQQGMITLEDIQAVRGGFFSMYALWNLTPYLTSEELKSKLFTAWLETLDETTHWLWDMVMGKLIPVLKEHGESATLIPAGQLALLPLHAAWTNDISKPTKRRYALDELNISYVPSAHALWQANLAVKRPANRLLAVDNPEADNPKRSLVFSKDEVKAVLSSFDKSNSKHLQGRIATLKAVKEEMQNAEVLHFSTHGAAGWQKPEDALLNLADDKNLTLSDIFKLDLNQTRLAVLSACETGVPGLELIDEMIGLPAGMLQAGVPGVVGSLWSVDDMSTAMMMACFYRLWRKEGCTPQEALCQAQIWLRDNATQQKKDFFKSFVEGKLSGLSVDTVNSFYKYLSIAEPDEVDFSSPYYWAAFAYTGV